MKKTVRAEIVRQPERLQGAAVYKPVVMVGGLETALLEALINSCLADAGMVIFRSASPAFLELGLRRGGFVVIFFAAQAFGQAEERPAVIRQPRQSREDVLGFGEFAGLHQTARASAAPGSSRPAVSVFQLVLLLHRQVQLDRPSSNLFSAMIFRLRACGRRARQPTPAVLLPSGVSLAPASRTPEDGLLLAGIGCFSLAARAIARAA